MLLLTITSNSAKVSSNQKNKEMRKLCIIFLISLVGCCAFSNTEKTVNLENNGQIVKAGVNTPLHLSVNAILENNNYTENYCLFCVYAFPQRERLTKVVNLKKLKVPS